LSAPQPPAPPRIGSLFRAALSNDNRQGSSYFSTIRNDFQKHRKHGPITIDMGSNHMPFREHFLTFARYNHWANGRIYDAAAGLSDAEYRRDRRGFFRSIHGTLNHILVGDRLWLNRLTGEGENPGSLDAILFDDLAGLRAAREAEDQRLLRTVDGYGEADLSGTLSYTNIAGGSYTQPLTLVLGHVFNHQTHHRGQVHDMVSQTGTTPPELDLIYFIREDGS